MQLKITARAIYDELSARGIAVQVVPLRLTQALLFDYQGKMRVIIGANPDVASASAGTIAQSKDLTYEIVQRYHMTTQPATQRYCDITQAKNFLHTHKQIVIKPVDGAHGNGVTTNVVRASQIAPAVAAALQFSESKQVIIQQQVCGLDLRVLVIDGECVGVVRREPASVVGNGTDTIERLIRYENTHNPDRGEKPYAKKMNKIDLDAVARYLTDKQRSYIPAQGEVYQVVGTANMGTGGRSVECRENVPIEIIHQAVAMSSFAGMFICGVDFLYDEQSGSWHLLEMNASPSFGLHMMPSEGKAIMELPKIYVDKLLKKYNETAYEDEA